MSEEIRRQIIFYQNYGGVGHTLCPLMVNQGFKTDVIYCDCEQLRRKMSVAALCGVDGKCPVREYSFAESKK